MDKIVEIGMLIDFYGKLLTHKQYEIIDLYYNNDYSLGEISEILGISRQGIRDSLKRSECILYDFEEKLQLVEKFLLQKNIISKLANKVAALQEEYKDVELNSKLLQIKKGLESLSLE